MTKLQLGWHCVSAGSHTWQQGLWPVLGSGGANGVNGGIPPNANLSLHLAALRDQITACIPDPTRTGLGVLDLEAWDPVWEMNNCTFAGERLYPGDCPADGWRGKYQHATLSWVQRLHPTWPAVEVLSEAKRQWEASAVAFFVETLTLLKALRPGMRWGVYMLPFKVHGPCAPDQAGPGRAQLCGFDHPTFGPKLRALYEAPQMAPIWQVADLIAPSIYLSTTPGGQHIDPKLQAGFIRSNVHQAWRLARLGRPAQTPRATVLAFGELYYHGVFGPIVAATAQPRAPSAVLAQEWVRDTADPVCNLGPKGPAANVSVTLLSSADAYAQVAVAADAGADAVALWAGGSLPYMRVPACRAQLLQWLNTTGGPSTNSARSVADACSAAQCHGRGACRRGPYESRAGNGLAAVALQGVAVHDSVDTFMPPHCECFDGFSGDACTDPE
jgi:hypothetical protein